MAHALSLGSVFTVGTDTRCQRHAAPEHVSPTPPAFTNYEGVATATLMKRDAANCFFRKAWRTNASRPCTIRSTFSHHTRHLPSPCAPLACRASQAAHWVPHAPTVLSITLKPWEPPDSCLTRISCSWLSSLGRLAPPVRAAAGLGEGLPVHMRMTGTWAHWLGILHYQRAMGT